MSEKSPRPEHNQENFTPPHLTVEQQGRVEYFRKAGEIWEALEADEEIDLPTTHEDAQGLTEALQYLEKIQQRPYTPEQKEAQYKKVDDYIEQLRAVQ